MNEPNNSLDWLNKLFVLDLSRPVFLNRPTIPQIESADILEKEFSDSLLRKTKAVSINLGERNFAQCKGYQVREYRGGAFVQYFNNGLDVNVLAEMSDEFSRFLTQRDLKHQRGQEDNKFWLRRTPTIVELREIASVPYVLELSMFVQYNSAPAVDVLIGEEPAKPKE